MRVAVPDHLAYCVKQGGVTFLDVRGDRYFGLPPVLEHAFVAIAEADFLLKEPNSLLEPLEALGVLVRGQARRADLTIPSANLSWVDEVSPTPPRLDPASLVATVTSVIRTRLSQKSKSLQALLEEVRTRRPGSPAHNWQLMRRLTAGFRASRAWAPIEPICLLDSLALLDFLHRRGLYPHIVFGVIRQPFAAHCWVQADDVVLNDRLDHVGEYTPILVV
uniref:Microcin J25-processing protein McjB C-terminal domain-containing protein n=1 Tax=Caulobacter sp. (strain K31) TaxID=366602 RepID=B0T9D7_CAUSK